MTILFGLPIITAAITFAIGCLYLFRKLWLKALACFLVTTNCLLIFALFAEAHRGAFASAHWQAEKRKVAELEKQIETLKEEK